MTARRVGLFLVAVALALGIAGPAVVLAAAVPTKIVMDAPKALPVQKSNPQSVMVLGATLTTADGKPVASQRIEFLMATDILGQKVASVGTAVSDSGGSARTTFVVTRTGAYELSARFAGTDALGASVAPVLKANFEALPETAPQEQLQLSRIGQWVPWAGLALTAVVWVTLIYVIASVLIVVPRAASRGASRGDRA